MSERTADLARALRAAAAAVRSAQAVLVLSGAGMGVDSGLGTFRGASAGIWPPMQAMGLTLPAMSNPEWFQSDPPLAWAFWAARFRAYTQATPHAGYATLARWGAARPLGFFSVTSNIDGHWLRTAGVREGRDLWEIHGALTHLQCVVDDGRVWPADAAAIGALDVPHWEPVVGQRLEVLPRGASGSAWVPATVAAADGSLVGEDGAALAVTAARLCSSAPGAGGGGCAAAATALQQQRDLFRVRVSAE